MSKNRYHSVLLLLLGMSLLLLVKGQLPTKFSLANQASERGVTPLDEEAPLNSEDQNSDSADDNKFEDDDVMFFDRQVLPLLLLVQKKNVAQAIQSFKEHSMEITTPPPRS